MLPFVSLGEGKLLEMKSSCNYRHRGHRRSKTCAAPISSKSRASRLSDIGHRDRPSYPPTLLPLLAFRVKFPSFFFSPLKESTKVHACPPDNPPFPYPLLLTHSHLFFFLLFTVVLLDFFFFFPLPFILGTFLRFVLPTLLSPSAPTAKNQTKA